MEDFIRERIASESTTNRQPRRAIRRSADHAESPVIRNIAHFGERPSFGTRVALNSRAMNDTSYRAAVVAFKRQLLESTLSSHGGNRTHTARALGLPRTYLVRLIRDLGVMAPVPGRQPNRPESSDPQSIAWP